MIHCTTCCWFYMTRQDGKQTLLHCGCNHPQRPDPCQCPGYQTLEDWMMKTWNKPESPKHLCSTCVWFNLPPNHRPIGCNPLRASIQACSGYKSPPEPLCSTCVWFHCWPDRMSTCCNPVRESIQHESPCSRYEKRQHDPPAPFPERYESSLPPETHTCKTCKYVSQPCCSWCKVLDPRRDCPDCWAPRPTGKKP